jgi:hypothetical protein
MVSDRHFVRSLVTFYRWREWREWLHANLHPACWVTMKRCESPNLSTIFLIFQVRPPMARRDWISAVVARPLNFASRRPIMRRGNPRIQGLVGHLGGTTLPGFPQLDFLRVQGAGAAISPATFCHRLSPLKRTLDRQIKSKVRRHRRNQTKRFLDYVLFFFVWFPSDVDTVTAPSSYSAIRCIPHDPFLEGKGADIVIRGFVRWWERTDA